MSRLGPSHVSEAESLCASVSSIQLQNLASSIQLPTQTVAAAWPVMCSQATNNMAAAGLAWQPANIQESIIVDTIRQDFTVYIGVNY